MQSIDRDVSQMQADIAAIERRLQSADLTDAEIKRGLEDLRALQLETNRLLLRQLTRPHPAR